MSWSKCQIEIGETGANDAPATQLSSVGTIKDKSSNLNGEGGATLEMKATGGETVGYEQQPGSYTLTTTVIEPTKELYELLGIGTTDAADDLGEQGSTIKVKSHVVGKEMTVKVTPKNKGAFGILAPKCSVSVAPTWDEENGHGLTITFGILKSQVLDYWYKKFKTKTAL